MAVMPATWKAEAGESQIQGQPGQLVKSCFEILKNLKSSMGGGYWERSSVVELFLPIRPEAIVPIPSTAKPKTNKKMHKFFK